MACVVGCIDSSVNQYYLLVFMLFKVTANQHRQFLSRKLLYSLLKNWHVLPHEILLISLKFCTQQCCRHWKKKKCQHSFHLQWMQLLSEDTYPKDVTFVLAINSNLQYIFFPLMKLSSLMKISSTYTIHIRWLSRALIVLRLVLVVDWIY